MQKKHHYENLHIPLWLLKDTCWMMQWKIAGTLMIIPTISVAIFLSIKSWRENSDEFWINMAICFWITANSFWMLCEFVHHEEIKNYAGIPFIVGIICVSIFYYKRLLNKKREKTIL